MPHDGSYDFTELVEDNRKRFRLLGGFLTAFGLSYFLEHVLHYSNEVFTHPHLTYTILYFSMIVAGVTANIYTFTSRKRALVYRKEYPLQVLMAVYMFAVGIIISVMNIQLGEGYTGFLTAAILLALFMRNRRWLIIALYAVSVPVLFVFLVIGERSGEPGLYLQLFFFAAIGLGLALVREMDHRENHNIRQSLMEQSIIDPLTDVYNRRFFIEELERTVQRRRRYGHRFCLAVIDLDDFKSINDTFGHLEGDSILESYAWILLDHLRDSDVVARYGGDEFMVILSELDLEEAHRVLERLREFLEGNIFAGINRSITCSIGLVECPEDGMTNKLIQAADEKLYQAKAKGRNTVCS